MLHKLQICGDGQIGFLPEQHHGSKESDSPQVTCASWRLSCIFAISAAPARAWASATSCLHSQHSLLATWPGMWPNPLLAAASWLRSRCCMRTAFAGSTCPHERYTRAECGAAAHLAASTRACASSIAARAASSRVATLASTTRSKSASESAPPVPPAEPAAAAARSASSDDSAAASRLACSARLCGHNRVSIAGSILGKHLGESIRSGACFVLLFRSSWAQKVKPHRPALSTTCLLIIVWTLAEGSN